MVNLDSDLLRTFLAVAQAGSVTDGAAQIHRSQSATSIQIKRLEAILGQPVFERHGRGVVLSGVGRKLLPIAQEVTARLDAALRDVSQRAVSGKLRVGIPDDHGRAKLAEIIAAFTRRHPKVELEVTCALSAEFPDALEKGGSILPFTRSKTQNSMKRRCLKIQPVGSHRQIRTFEPMKACRSPCSIMRVGGGTLHSSRLTRVGNLTVSPIPARAFLV